MRMYDYEIEEICKEVENFVGVFSRDEIPTIHHFPCSLILNTDKKSQRGRHWVAFWLDERRCEYFDSFGLPPIYKEMQKLYKNRQLIWNGRQIQNPNSKNCGAFCVSFVKEKAKGRTFKSFINLFKKDTSSNDKIAWKIIDNG